MLQSYLTRISAIAKHEWPWVIQAIDVLSSRGYPIDLDILWAVLDKGDDLPTGRVLECIWAAQGVSCCDRLKRAFAGHPQKRGEILDLLERVAPLEGLSIRVDEGQLHVDGLRG
jgi:hypothetical protein